MTFFSSSYRTSTNAPPIPLRTLDHAPLKKALPPSSLKIFRQQSIVPLYMMSAARGRDRRADWDVVLGRGTKGTAEDTLQTPNRMLLSG